MLDYISLQPQSSVDNLNLKIHDFDTAKPWLKTYSKRILYCVTMKPDSVEQSEHHSKLLTAEETAERLRITAEQVRSLIRKGQLAAINVGSGLKRPLYRIREKALDDFLERRWQSGTIAPKRKFKRPPPVQDFFPDLK